MRRTRLAAIGVATLLLTTAAGGEIVARSAIDARLPERHDARFTGASALLALATDAMQITVTVGPDELADALTEKLGRKAADRAQVVLGDGAVGVETTLRSRRLIAWFALDASGGALVATPVSMEVGGIQIAPGLLFGDGPIELPNPLDKRCGIPIDDVQVRPSGVDLTLTIARGDAACFKDSEAS